MKKKEKEMMFPFKLNIQTFADGGEGDPNPSDGDKGKQPTPPSEDKPKNEFLNLKGLLGEAYKDGITLQDVDAFLNGKKFKDLSSGEYVAKGKFEELQTKLNALTESTKDYDDLKKKIQGFEEKERIQTLNETAKKVGIDGQFIEFALSKINVQGDKVEEELAKWIEANPQFKVQTKKANSNPSYEGGNPKPTPQTTADAVKDYYQSQNKK